MRFINNKHFYFIWVFTSLFTFLHSHPPPVPFCSRRTRPSHRFHFPMNSVFFFISVPLSAISCPLHFYLIFAFCFFCLSFPLSLLHPDSTPPSIHQAPYRSLKNHWAVNLDPPLQGLIFDSISIIGLFPSGSWLTDSFPFSKWYSKIHLWNDWKPVHTGTQDSRRQNAITLSSVMGNWHTSYEKCMWGGITETKRKCASGNLEGWNTKRQKWQTLFLLKWTHSWP